MRGIKLRFNLTSFKGKNLTLIWGLLIVFVLLLLFGIFRDSSKLITHQEANRLYTKNKIEKIVVDAPYLYFYTSEGKFKIYQEAVNQKAFFSKYLVEVRQSNGIFLNSLLLMAIGLGAWGLFTLLQQKKPTKKPHIKSSAKEELPIDTTPIKALISSVRFSDVAGINDVKEELEEIIDFLKEPQKYRKFKIRLPKGVLLVGPPGVGKTLISKAVAGEANVPFFYQSGASFVHIYVGMGAKRVSELFAKAKQMAPSIIFIDEIDAVGKSRGGGRNDEREATLNELLTQMDGFEESSGVIVIGATNKIEMLDEALLRAGRFDRHIHISLPDLDERVKTLELYLAPKPHRVDILQVARMSVGFSSAGLSTLTNEAAIYAMREGKAFIETVDFEAVKEKVLLGKRKILSFSDEERKIQAIYQGAKAVVATWLDVEFDKIGIVNSRLFMHEHEILSKTILLSRIKVYLAGSVATKIAYKEQFTNGASDILQAKEIIKKVIYEYGMGESFAISAQEEALLLTKALSEVTTLLNSLEQAHKEITNHLLRHENITLKESRAILRKIF